MLKEGSAMDSATLEFLKEITVHWNGIEITSDVSFISTPPQNILVKTELEESLPESIIQEPLPIMQVPENSVINEISSNMFRNYEVKRPALDKKFEVKAVVKEIDRKLLQKLPKKPKLPATYKELSLIKELSVKSRLKKSVALNLPVLLRI